MSIEPTDSISQRILRITKARSILGKEVLQSLWSGYGAIVRYKLSGSTRSSIIVKQINFTTHSGHPRGWNTSHSHQRKLRSYQVEQFWYQHWASQCDEFSLVATCLDTILTDDGVVLVLEDLDYSGYPLRKHHLTLDEAQVCVRWLANYHARFINKAPDGLWSIDEPWRVKRRREAPDRFGLAGEAASQ